MATALTSQRQASNVAVEEPAKKAQSIIDSLPGNSLISKTAILSAGAGLSVFAISNEFYVVNEETIVAFATLSVFAAIFKYLGPSYVDWANGHIQRQKDILYAAKADHVKAVENRIVSVRELSGVIDITKALFEVSKVIASMGLYADYDRNSRHHRRPLVWRHKRMSSSRRLPLQLKQSLCSTHGFDMRGR